MLLRHGDEKGLVEEDFIMKGTGYLRRVRQGLGFLNQRAPMKLQEGKMGYILMWLLGVPIPILLVIYLLRGCD